MRVHRDQPFEARSPLARETYDAVVTPLDRFPAWIEPAVLIRSGKTLFGGAFGIGKSVVMMAIYRSLGLGEPLFQHPPFKVVGAPRVLLVEKEVGEWGMQKRFQQAFTLEEAEKLRGRLKYIPAAPGFQLDTEQGRKELEIELEAFQPNVVLLDPATKFMVGDDSDNQSVAALLRTIDELIEKYRHLGLSFVLSHHFRKPSQDKENYDPLDFYNVRGGAKWVDDPDTRIVLHKVLRKDDPIPSPGWTLESRYHFRHAEEIKSDIKLGVNEDGRMRVRWIGSKQIDVHREKGFIRPSPPNYKPHSSIED